MNGNYLQTKYGMSVLVTFSGSVISIVTVIGLVTSISDC